MNQFILIFVIIFAEFGYASKFPVIIRGPGVKTVNLTESFSFDCETSHYGDAPQALYWEINGKGISIDQQIHIFSHNAKMSSLRVDNASAEMEGMYCCNADNGYNVAASCGSLKVRRAPRIIQPPENHTTTVGNTIELHCLVDGYPKYTVAWYHNGTLIDCLVPKNEQDCHAYFVTPSDNLRVYDASFTEAGKYTCGARNQIGATLSLPAFVIVEEKRKTFGDVSVEAVLTTSRIALDHEMEEFIDHYLPGNLTDPIKDRSNDSDELYHQTAVIRGSFLLIVVFLGFCLVACMIIFKICDRKKKIIVGRKTIRACKSYELRERRSSGSLLNRHNITDDLAELAYPAKRLNILNVIGEGVFGLVFKAKAPDLLALGRTTIVAAKTVRVEKGQDPSRANDLCREAELLSTFRHQNIIQLLGVCLNEDTVPAGISCLLFEYVDGGDLCMYLRSIGPNKSLFLTEVKTERTKVLEDMSDRTKLSISTDIARGMSYLSERNFIHRDLATRNCLISESTMHVKIADFGLSRRTYESDYYKASDEESVPIRWMAPESILYGKYSSQSDVWAFGITLWEIYTYALQPYFSQTNEEVICCVCEGNILSAPTDTPPSMYNLMRLCWHRRPEERPSFATIHSALEAILQNQGGLPLTGTLTTLYPPDGTQPVLEPEPSKRMNLPIIGPKPPMGYADSPKPVPPVLHQKKFAGSFNVINSIGVNSASGHLPCMPKSESAPVNRQSLALVHVPQTKKKGPEGGFDSVQPERSSYLHQVPGNESIV